MKLGTKYMKIVEWSDEDQCFVGSAPGLFWGGCHGDNELKIFAELQQIVEETIGIYKLEGRPLPPSTSTKNLTDVLRDVA